MHTTETADWVAVDAVRCEPVSACLQGRTGNYSHFDPENREIEAFRLRCQPKFPRSGDDLAAAEATFLLLPETGSVKRITGKRNRQNRVPVTREQGVLRSLRPTSG